MDGLRSMQRPSAADPDDRDGDHLHIVTTTRRHSMAALMAPDDYERDAAQPDVTRQAA